MSRPPIFHLARRSEWESLDSIKAGVYLPASFVSEGFIHCSERHQIERVGNALFHDQTDLLLLVIAPARLTVPIVDEDCYASGEAFPHLYGPLNREAVVGVWPWNPATDGPLRLSQLWA